MRPTPHPLLPALLPGLLPGLLPVLLLAVVATLVSGCSGDDEATDAGPTVVATGPHGTTTATDPADPTSPATSAEASLAPEVAEVCAPYAVMVAAIQDAAMHATGAEDIAAAIAPVMKRFAHQVGALEKPPGMDPETWAGVVALAQRIQRLPAHPSKADIDAVERELSPDQREAVEAAADWFRSTCGR